jgi:predicted RecA/RadA family phage recombinase
MQNFEKEGEVQTFTTPAGGVVSGTPVQIGQVLVVPATTVTAAQVTADPTITFEGKIRGVFTVTKAASQAWTEGQLVYWDAANSRFTSVSAGNHLAGWATEVAASGADLTTGHVYLDGGAREDEAT